MSNCRVWNTESNSDLRCSEYLSRLTTCIAYDEFQATSEDSNRVSGGYIACRHRRQDLKVACVERSKNSMSIDIVEVVVRGVSVRM